MKKLFLILCLNSLLNALSIVDIIDKNISLSSLVNERITMQGRIDAKDKCTDICKIRIKTRINGYLLYSVLIYKKEDARSLMRKWVSNEIIASCVVAPNFTFIDCKD